MNKPIMLPFGPCNDLELCCPICKEPIRFPLIRNPQHIYDNRPTKCKKCGAKFDWSE